MASPRPYLSRAPIVEAVIDFRVLRRDGLSADLFAGLETAVGVTAKGSLMQSIEARFGEHGRVVDSAVFSAIGWQYRADSHVAQFRVDGFTYSKLSPYTTWPEVYKEASRLWEVYVSQAKPLEVSRVAVRYINRLQVPGPAELREYLTAPPVVPAPVSQDLREFLSRVVIDDSGRSAQATLVQASESSLDAAKIPLLLDIDAFRHVRMQPNDSALGDVFEQLRALKNEIFYASVTDRTVEMYA